MELVSGWLELRYSSALRIIHARLGEFEEIFSDSCGKVCNTCSKENNSEKHSRNEHWLSGN
jgi:hypothetical protein